MQAEMPIFDSPEDAIRSCVQAIGGAKKVGPMLWPEKPIEQATALLLDCLNSERPQKLSLSQVLMVFRITKKAGFHAGFQWFASEAEYDVRPITPEEETDRLASIIAESSKTLERAIQALSKVQSTTQVKRVA